MPPPSKPIAPVLGEGRQAATGRQAWCAADAFVALEHRQADLVVHRDQQRSWRLPFGLRGHGAVASQRVAVDRQRGKPPSVAIRSAPMPCGTKPVASPGGGSAPRRRRHCRRHARHDSRRRRPTTRSSQPLATFCAAGSPPPGPRRRSGLICTPAARKSQPPSAPRSVAITEPCSPIRRDHAHHHVVHSGSKSGAAAASPEQAGEGRPA